MARAKYGDVYHSVAYHRLYEDPAKGVRAFAYLAEDGRSALFHPFLLREIRSVGEAAVEGGLQDIESVYGYSGPVANDADAGFLHAAWKDYDVWCQASNVVSEFVRFNPLLDNTSAAHPEMRLVLDRQTVTVLLDSADSIRSQCEPVQRNRIRKAVKNGLSFEMLTLAEGLPIFVPIYLGTMTRLDAAPFYLFSRQYFSSLARDLRDHGVVAVVRHGGVPLASALFLLGEGLIHYHLGGSVTHGRAFAPNNLLFYETALWAGERGFRHLHLGGGRTPDPADTLLRFKARFSPNRSTFFVGTRVNDEVAYAKLVALWRRQQPTPPSHAYFQLYRLQPARTGS